MKVTIDVPDVYVPILKRWASVSRTINSAIEALMFPSEVTADQLEQIHNTVGELQEIGPALDSLHATVRSEIWKSTKS